MVRKVLSFLVGLALVSGGAVTRAQSTTKPSPQTDEQCTDDAAKQGLRSCVDYGQTQANGMHMCPAGFAMTGGGARNNHFHCTYVGNYADTYTAHAETQRTYGGYDSMACRDGYFLIGLNEEQLRMTCATVNRVITVPNERQVALSSLAICPGTVQGKQLGVVTGWNTYRGSMLCSTIAPSVPLKQSTR